MQGKSGAKPKETPEGKAIGIPMGGAKGNAKGETKQKSGEGWVVWVGLGCCGLGWVVVG